MRAFALMFLLAWVAGIALGVVLGYAYWIFLAAAFLSILSWRFPTGKRIAALMLFLLGVVWGEAVNSLPVKECAFARQFTARVQTVYRIESERAQYELATDPDCVILLTTSRFPEYRVGDQLTVLGTAQPVQEIPEEFSGYQVYLVRRGVAATVRYPNIELEQRSEGWLSRVQRFLRQTIGQTFPEPEASLTAAMIIGDRGTLPEEVTVAFQRTGVSHILAISGFNVTLLAGIVAGGLLFLPLSPRARAAVAISLVWLYVVIAGSPVSAQRAAWFWTLVILALQLHLLLGFTSVLLIAGLFMISFSPLVVYDVGWQLSMAAVVGIWLTLFLFPQKKIWRLPKAISILLLSSFGATVATWPIVAYHFGLISLVSLPANLVIVPLTSIFMTMGLIALLGHIIFPPLGLLIGFGVHVVWRAMESYVMFLSALPLSALTEVPLPLWVVPAYYVVLTAITIVIFRFQHRNWREIWE